MTGDEGAAARDPHQGLDVAQRREPARPRLGSLPADVPDPTRREWLLAAILEHLAEPVALARADGRIAWANPALQRLSGFDHAELTGRALRPPAPPGLEVGAQGAWQELCAGRALEDEQRFEHRDGLSHRVRRSFAPIRGPDGAVTHVLVTYEDLTARASLREDHRLFMRTLNAVVLFDDDGRCIEANPVAKDLTGYELDGEVPMAIADVLVDEDRARLRARWADFLSDGQRRGTYTLRHRDGRLVDVEVQAVAGVRPGLHLATLRDVTAERRAQAELEFQSQVLDSAGEAVIVTAPDGRVEYWNAEAERLYGYTADEVLGSHILEVTPVSSAVPHGHDVKAALARGVPWSGELLVRDRAGRWFPIWTTSTPLHDDAGRLTGVIGVSRDVSELRQAQEQLQRREAQQRAVAELGQQILDVRDLDTVLHRVCEVVVDVLGVELAKVLELSDDGEVLRVRAGVGWQPGVVGHAEVSVDASSQAGFTLAAAEPVVVTDVRRETRFASPRLLVDHGVASGISVVIPSGERTYGVLGIHSRRPRAFSADDATFLRSVAHVIGAAVDRHEATAELERLALFDPLTGLPNRTLLLDRIARLRDRVGRGAGRVSVLLADLDGLKLINDALGRLAGDELLVEVARRLAAVVPEGCTVARVGDDEFVVVQEHEAADEAVAGSRSLELADRMEMAVAGHYDLADQEVFVSTYVGVAVQAEDDDGPALLRKAESAARQAKRRARERSELYEPEVGSRVGQQLELINELRHALMNDEFRVVYQPEIDLRTGELFGIEALVRWQHPERGLLAPAAFLDTAERIGLLGAIGQSVLREAAREVVALSHRHTELARLNLAVNVAADQLVEPGFVALVDQVLSDTGLEPARLYLEITESAIIEDHDRALDTLEQLRDRGVQIALDDFGTGFSSLTHLHRFPIDLLKIDRAFVDNVTRGGRARAIVEATVTLAHALGLRCVAEGVEQDEHFDELDALGCDIGQGYLWSRPLPPAELEQWVRDYRRQVG